MSTYDPVSTATALAENYVYARQNQLDAASKVAQEQTSALTSLKSSLTTFSSALSTLTSKGEITALKATVSSEQVASANATPKASAGSYSFHVEKLATAQQSLYDVEDLGFDFIAGEDQKMQVPEPSKFAVAVGVDGVFYSIDLAAADKDGDQKLSVTEIARAINEAAKGKVTAAVMTNPQGKQQLLLNAAQTGVEGAFQIRAVDGNTSPISKELVKAEDAHIKVGGAEGVDVYQSTNTYTGIAGLSVTFNQKTAEPVTVNVSKDDATTKANMQGFVDAYNTLLKTLDKLTASGNAEGGVAAGPLVSDSSVRSMRNRLNDLLRMTVGGESLTGFGITGQRDGTIALDGDKFLKKVNEKPEALSSLLGATNALEYKRSGVLGGMQTYLDSWTKSTGGVLDSRQSALQKQQSSFSRQQNAIDTLYEQVYQRYLVQFSTLSNLEAQMSSTTGMLSAMFNSNKS